MKRRFLVIAVVLISAAMLFAGGNKETVVEDASAWPSKPVNIVVTSSAGGDGDYFMRTLSVPLAEELGVPVVVTNLAGGNGTIGMDELTQKDPDGYTFYVNNTCALAANQLTGLADYDWTISDPVAVFAKHSGEMLWVRDDSPYQTVADIIKASQADPGHLTIGVSLGGSVYVASLMLQNAGAQFSIVDANDGAERIIALLGGQVDCCIAGYGIGKEYIESGDLRPLCTLMAERSLALPDVPTANESGAEGLIINNLFVLLAPKGTNPEVIEKFNAAITKVITENQDYRDSVFQYSGQEAYVLSVEETKQALSDTRDQFMAYSDLI